LETKFASAHQISLKVGDSRLKYCDKTIFKMAAVHHLEFSKSAILVILAEHDSASSHEISHQSDNKSVKYGQKMIFNMAAGRHFELAKF